MSLQSANDVLADVRAAFRRSFLAAGLFSLGVNVLMLTVPFYMLQIFDRVLLSRSLETLLLLTLIAVAGLLTLGLLDAVRGLVVLRFGSWMERQLGGYALAAGVMRGLRRSQTNAQGLRDLTTVRTFLTGHGIFPFLDAPWTPLFLLAVFLLHPTLGLVATAGALVLAVLAVTNEVATRRLNDRSSETTNNATEDAHKAMRNADAIEAMGMLPALIDRWYGKADVSLAMHARAAARSVALTSFSRFIRLALQLGILGVAAFYVVENQITAGAMVAASILLGRALAPIEMAIGSWRSATAARKAYQNLQRLIQGTPMDRAPIKLPRPKGWLVVDGITFFYPGSKDPLLRGVSFALQPGECLGLVGPAAAGKTTLARLVAGTLVPSHGHVRLDGMEMSQWPTTERGRYVGYVPQGIELFNGTVAENIARMQDGEREAVIEAAQLVGAHETILSLPDGYETEIGDAGAALSGGQRQQIALARAVYGGPCLVVFDEPSASLDSRGEAYLLHALETLRERGVTTVVVAHRPTLLQKADKVLLLRDGMVEAFGPRSELLPRLVRPAAALRAPQQLGQGIWLT